MREKLQRLSETMLIKSNSCVKEKNEKSFGTCSHSISSDAV